MKLYRITETYYYHVEAESEEDALERFDRMTSEEKKNARHNEENDNDGVEEITA